MASPYLLVGLYPDLLRFIPKPGAWMETFKQICGWILIATVVFILTFIDAAAVVPTVLLLVGVGVACWLVSRTPLTASVNDQLQSWALAGAMLLVFGVASFGWLYPDVMRPRFAAIGSTSGAVLTSGSGWQPFSLERLQQVAVEDRRTVMVDFSAEWCLTCKTLEKAVLHTEPIERAIADANVVTMYGDFTDYPAEIERTLKALRSNGVPVIAIFPGDRPYNPIVFRGAYTKSGLLSALVEATGRGSATISRAAVAEAPPGIPPLN
jgi:suppressor for copper-sensitivity B